VKLQGARLAGYLKDPDPSLRAVLIYGPDAGLVRERAERIARGVVPDAGDPFRIAAMTADMLAADQARLDDEARALSLMPGRRLVHVREAGDALAPQFERFFKATPPGDSLVLLEASDLAARSALRRAFEGARQGGAIACYADGPEELRQLVREIMAPRKIAVDGEAMDYLVAHLGGDRALSRQELEKLALYVGDGGRLGIEEARATVGDSAALELEDAIYAAADGNAAALERCLDRVFGDGEQPTSVLRAALRHFQRLYLAGSRQAAGMAAEEALQSLRPPLFFKLRDRFRDELRRWPPQRAVSALELLLEAERATRRTGVPADAVCRDALLRLARGNAPRSR
jgi:DNA polymerase III subunit delta